MPDEIIIQGTIHDTGATRGNRLLRAVLTKYRSRLAGGLEIWQDYSNQFAILSSQIGEAGMSWAEQIEREERRPCRYERVWEIQMPGQPAPPLRRTPIVMDSAQAASDVLRNLVNQAGYLQDHNLMTGRRMNRIPPASRYHNPTTDHRLDSRIWGVTDETGR